MSKSFSNGADLRPEARLLLCCARSRLDSAAADQATALLQRDIDWEYLLGLAAQHGVSALLYRSLQAVGPHSVPPAVIERLHNIFVTNAQHNLYLTRALLKILDSCEAEQVSASPYKGPMLAATAYGNLSLRQFCDLDLLVREQDILKVMELLSANGYRLVPQLSGPEEAAHLLAHKKDFRFVSHDDRVVVELHWRITGKHFYFPFSLDSLWKRLEPVSLSGTTVLNIPPEDSLVILCAHGSKHLWCRLLWICDINELVRSHPNLNWEQAIRQASNYGGLHLANSLLGTPLPDGISKAIKVDRSIELLTTEVFKYLFFNTASATEEAEYYTYQYYPFYIRLREKIWDKARLGYQYCLAYFRVALTPNELDREVVSLPAFFSFLYYLLRPMRLLKDYSFNSSKQPMKKVKGKTLS
jgi:hypothetical protein